MYLGKNSHLGDRHRSLHTRGRGRSELQGRWKFSAAHPGTQASMWQVPLSSGCPFLWHLRTRVSCNGDRRYAINQEADFVPRCLCGSSGAVPRICHRVLHGRHPPCRYCLGHTRTDSTACLHRARVDGLRYLILSYVWWIGMVVGSNYSLAEEPRR